MEMTSSWFVFCVLMVGMTIMVAWGLIGARFHSKPWLMIVVAVIVLVPVMVYQVSMVEHPLPSDAPEVFVKMRVLLLVWMSAVVALAGALIGVGIGNQSSRLYEAETARIRRTQERVRRLLAKADKARAVTQSMVYESEVQRRMDLLQT